jgi:hypothetical protein
MPFYVAVELLPYGRCLTLSRSTTRTSRSLVSGFTPRQPREVVPRKGIGCRHYVVTSTLWHTTSQLPTAESTLDSLSQ